MSRWFATVLAFGVGGDVPLLPLGADSIDVLALLHDAKGQYSMHSLVSWRCMLIVDLFVIDGLAYCLVEYKWVTQLSREWA